MDFKREMELLIKSKYPLVCVSTPEEEIVTLWLYETARNLDMNFFRWSVSKGLAAQMNGNSFYRSNDPLAMLKLSSDLLGDGRDSIFVLYDFDKHLSNNVLLRLFKELLNAAGKTRSTFVIVGSSPKVPDDISSFSASISAGTPSEGDILEELKKIESEFRNSPIDIVISLGEKDLKRAVNLLKGLSFRQIRMIVTQCIMDDGRFTIADFAKLAKYKKEVFDKQGALEYFPGEKSVSIAGFRNLKEWVGKRKAAFFSNDSRLPPPKGVLLLGVQGSGKSLAAKVIADELEIPLYRLDIGGLYSKYIGETEENMKKALETADRISPLCLWLDEIEKMLSSSGEEMDGGVSRRITGRFLTWMQERKSKIFIAATANDIKSLPPELLRKGRFDEIFFSDLPDFATRKEVFKIHLLKRGIDFGSFNLDLLAERSAGFSGAEIEQAVISAMYDSLNEGMNPGEGALLKELEKTSPLSLVRREDVEFLRKWATERRIKPV